MRPRDDDERRAQPVSKEDVQVLEEGYAKHREKDKDDRGKKLDRELRELETLSRKFEKQARKGLERAGIDVEAMKADFAAASQGDPESGPERFEEARAKWQPQLRKAVEESGIDRARGRAEAMAAVGLDDRPRELERVVGDDEGGVGGGTGLGGGWSPPPPPPAPPSATRLDLNAPYTLGATTSTATANRNTGQLSSLNTILVGALQQLASVGAPFHADAGVRRVRVETTVDASYWTQVGACWGFGSGEALLNLKVLDGTTLKGHQRLSLVRTIAVVLWISSDRGSGAYTLSCEFAHSFGTPRTYAALVELETWTGTGGALIVSGATVSANAAPRGLTVTLIR